MFVQLPTQELGEAIPERLPGVKDDQRAERAHQPVQHGDDLNLKFVGVFIGVRLDKLVYHHFGEAV
jgi:hypothetical protein